MGIQYIGLWIFFTLIAILAVATYLYSRWQVRGPGIKLWLRKVWAIITFQREKSIARVKRGKVVTSIDFKKEIELAKASASTAQERLSTDRKVEQLRRAEEQAQKELKMKKGSSKGKIFRKKKVEEDVAVENTKTSIFDDLNKELVAQDLLHTEENILSDDKVSNTKTTETKKTSERKGRLFRKKRKDSLSSKDQSILDKEIVKDTKILEATLSSIDKNVDIEDIHVSDVDVKFDFDRPDLSKGEKHEILVERAEELGVDREDAEIESSTELIEEIEILQEEKANK